jgi:predicted CoA-binding protein
MPTRADIDDFMSQRRLAVVGVSHNEKKFGNVVYRQFAKEGRTVYAVNAGADEVEGTRCYHSLQELPEPVDGVVVAVKAERAADAVRDAIAAGVPRVWLQRGLGPSSVSPEAVQLCKEHGVECIDGACVLMWDEPVRGGHRFHRVLSGKRIAH